MASPGLEGASTSRCVINIKLHEYPNRREYDVMDIRIPDRSDEINVHTLKIRQTISRCFAYIYCMCTVGDGGGDVVIGIVVSDDVVDEKILMV